MSYADEVAAKECISRSDVYRRGLRALKRARHDYRSPLQGMLHLATLFERGMVNRREAADDIRRLVKEMDAMRRADVEKDPEKDPAVTPGRSGVAVS